MQRKSCQAMVAAAYCAVAVAASGCSIDSYGLVAANVTRADGALVVDVYSLGANLRTHADDPGLTLGAAKRSYVFPLAAGAGLAPGWHYLWATLPERPAVAQNMQSLGLDLRSGAAGVGVTLGYGETAILAQADDAASFVLQLTYRPAAPGLTRLRYCDGETPC